MLFPHIQRDFALHYAPLIYRLELLILTAFNKTLRLLLVSLLFWLPKEREKRINRWQRGRKEYCKLQQADAIIIAFGKSGRTWLRVMVSRFYSLKHGLKASSLIGFDNMNNKNNAIPKLFFSRDNYLKDYTGNVDNKADYYDSKVVLLVREPSMWLYRNSSSGSFV